MKILKQFIFVFAAIAGLSFAVAAQKDPKKPPPKDPPPVIKPEDKQRPPKEDRPKKPSYSYFVSIRTEGEFAE